MLAAKLHYANYIQKLLKQKCRAPLHDVCKHYNAHIMII